MEKEIKEITFGAKDSELYKFEYTIPEGYDARIEDGKVIVQKKESEDEKIRKVLLRCCDDWEKGQFGCMAKEDVPAIRAYLEKQKEQKPVSVFTFDDILALESAMNMAKHDNDSDLYNALQNIFERVHDIYHGEVPKPAECSEKHIAGIFEKVGLAKIVREQENDKLTNALQNAMIELSKMENAEWSEEDEKMVRFYEASYNNQIGDMSMKDVIDMKIKFKNWLVNRVKSLRPQPHWKPSEEQMDILDKVYHYLWADRNATADMQDGLGDFIDELKSL